MKRVLALLVALGGLGLLIGKLRHRGSVEAAPALDPRAEELRRRIAETRIATPPPEDSASATTDPAPDAGDVAAARRRVYEQGRAAVDEMRRAGGDATGQSSS